MKVQRNHHETEYSNVLQALSFTGLTNRVIKWELTFVERTQISILLKHAQICTSDLHLKMFHKLARCYRNLGGNFFRVKQYGRKNNNFYFIEKKKKKKKNKKKKYKKIINFFFKKKKKKKKKKNDQRQRCK